MSDPSANQPFQLEPYIMHHVLDGHEWKLPFLPAIPLPSFLSLHGLMVLLCAAFLVILFTVFYRRHDRVPQGISNVLEIFVLFIRDQIVVPCIGEEDGRKLTPLFCTFFFFILGMNLMGMVPLFATATADINVTAALALVTLTLMTGISLIKHGPVKFLKTFVPSGVPKPVLIILIPIEIVGFFIKPFALMIRLLANMFAGHVVILALLGLVVLLGFAAAPIIFLALFILLLEVLVSFLQAYIFTFLSAMFIGQMAHPQH